ncbi:MAG: hypothetical protein RL424_1034 [Pseudomonadota bacterium]
MLKRFFITGLLIWVPLGITYWVLSTIVKTLDGIIPPHMSPQALFGLEIPGFGLLAVVLVVLVTGAFGANLLGRRLVDLWEGLLARIPLVRSIYSSYSTGEVHLFLGEAGQRHHSGAERAGVSPGRAGAVSAPGRLDNCLCNG